MIEHRAERLPILNPERKIAELFLQRNARIVPQAGNLSAALLGDRKRFQHVVHFGRLEIQPRRFARSQITGPLEKSNAVLIEDDIPHGKFGGRQRGDAQE
ncbi:MAG: hypothetical protein M3Y07_11335 [Acidobacteriota bacterium]|nr:hypothetical protein [Acidobacteriota bacterium]